MKWVTLCPIGLVQKTEKGKDSQKRGRAKDKEASCAWISCSEFARIVRMRSRVVTAKITSDVVPTRSTEQPMQST